MTLSLSITDSYNGEPIDAILVRQQGSDEVQSNAAHKLPVRACKKRLLTP
jgi:hypothetical protein